MGTLRLIAVCTIPMKEEGERKSLEMKVRNKLKGIGAGATLYFRQDMADDTKTPPDEAK